MAGDALQSLGALFQWIQASDLSVKDFRREALEQLCAHVAFDKAIWANADISGQMSLRSAELFNIASAQRPDFERAAFADPRLLQVLQAPGVAHAYSVGPDDPVVYRELTEAIDVGHVISIAHFDMTLGVASGITLVRPARAQAFNEASRHFVEIVFPLLITGWTKCQLAALETASSRLLTTAACTDGVLNAAGPGFLALMHQEWPDWTGPHLPPELIEPISEEPKPTYLGQHIVINARMAVDTALITARPRSAVDDLTARERAVAELCAQGLTYKEISAVLHLAPATTRNHIAAVHKRLDVARNSEIARVLGISRP
jgi:DNA-binding CsgD family transcriptional regulator